MDIFNNRPDEQPPEFQPSPAFPQWGEVEIGGIVVDDYETGRAIPAVYVQIPCNPFVGPPEALERVASELLKAAAAAREQAGTMARLKNTHN